MPGTDLVFSVQGTRAKDRRHGFRYKLQLTCRVSGLGEDSTQFAGTTKNVSRSGMLVVFEGDPPESLLQIGSTMRILLDLPRSPTFAPRCLECMTTVARVAEKEKDHCSIAFRIHRIQVRQLDDQGEIQAEVFPDVSPGLIQ